MLKKYRITLLEGILVCGAAALAMALFAVLVLSLYGEQKAVWYPDYEKVNLSEALGSVQNPDAEDLELLLMQTGLGSQAVERVLQQEEPLAELEKYQQDFFNSNDYNCSQIGIITYEERNRNEEGKLKRTFRLADVRDGDVLIANSTHSVGWRHGHAGIVTDADKQVVVEALLWGEPSVEQELWRWETYPRVMVLRVKAEEARKRGYEPEKLQKLVADYAIDHVLDIDYGLLTGIPHKAPDKIAKTQCAHLVWYAYRHFGLDTDSDGGWLVTPKDLANSDLLEVVQVYGVNPKDIWP